MSAPVRRSGAAAGVLFALVLSAVLYGLLVSAALLGGPGALLVSVVLVVAVLHGCLTGQSRHAAASSRSRVGADRSADRVLSARRG